LKNYIIVFYAVFRAIFCKCKGQSLMDGATMPSKRGKLDEKRQKFRALAEARTNRAIEAITRIGNLSNRQTYEFDEAEVRKIVRALRDTVSSIEARFGSPRGKGGGGFKL
jgi:tellurite resistance protein